MITVYITKSFPNLRDKENIFRWEFNLISTLKNILTVYEKETMYEKKVNKLFLCTLQSVLQGLNVRKQTPGRFITEIVQKCSRDNSGT